MIKHIMVTTDGSNAAERGVEFAGALALRYHARLTVLQAFMQARDTAGQPLPRTLSDAVKGLETLRRRLLDMGVGQVDIQAVEGPAVNVITGGVESCAPDLLVIAARGHSTWPGHILGSVSMAVTQRVDCPVLVVR